MVDTRDVAANASGEPVVHQSQQGASEDQGRTWDAKRFAVMEATATSLMQSVEKSTQLILKWKEARELARKGETVAAKKEEGENAAAAAVAETVIPPAAARAASPPPAGNTTIIKIDRQLSPVFSDEEDEQFKPRKTVSNDEKGVRVKDRLALMQLQMDQHLELLQQQQGRQDSGSHSIASREVELDDQHDCREEGTGYEVSTQVDLPELSKSASPQNEETTTSESSQSSHKSPTIPVAPTRSRSMSRRKSKKVATEAAKPPTPQPNKASGKKKGMGIKGLFRRRKAAQQ